LARKDVAVAVVDDASTSRMVLRLIEQFSLDDISLVKIMKQKNGGFDVHGSLRIGWDYLRKHFACRYLSNIDSDVDMKAGWLDRLQSIHQRERRRMGPLVVTGFNGHSHPVLKEFGDYYQKESIGGLNMFFDVDFYDEIVKPNLKYEQETRVGWDWLVVHAMWEKGYPLVCTKPSVLQHIGKRGIFSGPSNYDRAPDF